MGRTKVARIAKLLSEHRAHTFKLKQCFSMAADIDGLCWFACV
jgi:hypothetical protein